MKNLLYISLIAVLITGSVFQPKKASAQAPQKMSYQAVIRNSSNALIISKTVGMRISILKGTSTGNSVYVEKQTTTTNINGLTSLEIGSGTVVSGNFSSINWASGPYFIKTETDQTGGTNYTIIGTSELLSVPYALFSGNGTNGAGNSWTITGNDIYNNNTGNIGIGLNSPKAPLHIKNDAEAIRLQGTTPYISFYDNSGVNKSFIQNYNNNLYLGTPAANTTGNLQFYLKNTPVMTILPSGNVGIGTANPVSKLAIQALTNDYGFTHTDGIVTLGSWIGNSAGATGGWIGTKSNHPLNFFTANLGAQMTLLPNGNFGIGNVNPTNKLQIGANIPGFEAYDFFLGNGTDGMGFSQSSSISYWRSTTNISLSPRAGNVGINTNAPTNKLQIGSLGSTGFAGNDLAIGNGTNAVAIYQTNASTLIGSTTDIVFKPRNNGHGRVGINTNTPGYPLEVADFVNSIAIEFAYYAMGPNGSNFYPTANYGGTSDITDASIYASNRILASEFNAFSDGRIKTVTGISDPSKDLEILNALKVTDYTMKDIVKFGNKPFKKVIAQDVEKVFPQVVSKHTDFIPNVYQLTSKVEKTDNGYLLTFANEHNINNTAKKLRVILSDGMQEMEIVSLPSDKQVIINAIDLKTDKVFVYGEEVNDFRTVDYEGLTTLNISATQELYKLLKKQQGIIENQQKQMDLMEKRVTTWEASR